MAAFRGTPSDVVPFAPNIYLWFYYHKFHGTLPADLAGAQHPLDVLRFLGADMLVRWDTMWALEESFTAGEYRSEFTGETPFAEPVTTAFNVYPPHRGERHSSYRCVEGTLTEAWRFTPEAGADFEAKHWWTEWSEYATVRAMLEAKEYRLNKPLQQHWVDQVGNDGVVMGHLTQSPLKTLHWLAGPQNASLFIMDHPQEMKALAQIHEDKAIALLGRLVDESDADIYVSLDNLDSVFYPPRFYRDYCDSFFSRAAELLHRHGKFLLVHACGRNYKLLPLVGASGIDCLEGITPPPLGDVVLGEARALAGTPGFVVDGGMDTSHLEVTQDAREVIHKYTRELFDSMGDKSHFIFASSCMTGPLTPWENLLHFRDAAREYGQL
jgi:hypothetical protein